MTATGTAYNLNASNLELFAVVPNHTIKIDDFSVAGNVVTWTFLGTDQKFTGPYTLTLIENRGQSTMMTVDYCNAFGLVRWSCQAGWDESADVNSNLSLTSEIFTHQIALSKEVQDAIDGNITEYNVSNHFPTDGIDGSNRYTLESAIAKIPESLRNVGIKCSFLNVAGRLETWEYNGTNWEQIGIGGFVKITSAELCMQGLESDGNPIGLKAERLDGMIFPQDLNIGDTLALQESIYRNVLKVVICGISGIISVKDVLASTGLEGIVITDRDNKVLDIAYTNSADTYRNASLHIKSSNAYYAYCPEIISKDREATLSLNPNIGINHIKNDLNNSLNIIYSKGIDTYNYLSYKYFTPAPTLGEEIHIRQDNYRSCGILDLSTVRSNCIKISNINAQDESSTGAIVDTDGMVLGVLSLPQYNTLSEAVVDLRQYGSAAYIYFPFSDTHMPVVVSFRSLGLDDEIDGISKKEIQYIHHDGKGISFGCTIGNPFEMEDNRYRDVIEVDISKLNGIIDITNILGDVSGKNLVIADDKDIILDIVSNSTSNEYVQEIVVNLNEYTNAYKIYTVCTPAETSQYSFPVVTNYYDGLKHRVSVLESNMPHHGVVLLHFDDPLYPSDPRYTLVENYGFPVSWCLAKTQFGSDGNDNTFSSWRSEEYKNMYWNAIRRGDDFGIYPSIVANEKNESEWKEWIATAIGNLHNLDIYNITAFMCGRLDINEDLLNAAKRFFKIIRGGGSNDTSVDTYDYTKDNIYMPVHPTNTKFVVNKTMFLGNSSHFEEIFGNIRYAVNANKAVSIFAHRIDEDIHSTVNITQENLVSVFDFLKEQVDNHGLQLMTWRQYYRLVNPNEGYEWDYNRIVNMTIKD